MEVRYLFTDGTNWILGPTKECTIPTGHYRKTHFLRDGVDYVGFVNIHDSGDVFQPLPVTSYLKNAAGDAYASLAEINAAISGFFFNVGGLLTSEGLTFTDSVTGLKFRAIIRDSQLYFDKELTATGFAGTESTDGGATGDWMTIGGF